MFKVFLKHLIFEKCIDIFFANIIRNFFKPSLKAKVGKRYREVQFLQGIFHSNTPAFKVHIICGMRIIKHSIKEILYEADYEAKVTRPTPDFVDSSKIIFPTGTIQGSILWSDILNYKIIKE